MLSPFRMVCRDFILPEPASYVFFYAIFNLRNLLYIIASKKSGMRTNRKNRIKIARRSNCADKSSQRVKSVCLLWATARTCSVARSTSGNTTPPTMRNTRYPRKRWRTRSSPPSSRRRRSISATPTSGAVALPLLHSTAPALSAIHALHIVGQIPQRHVPRTGVVGGYSLRVNSLHAVFISDDTA